MRVFHNSFSPVGETSWSRCNLPGELAGETRSDARMASEGPRATIKKRRPLTVARGPVPRQRSRARSCRAGSSEALASLPSDPDLFVIRRSQTTEVETHIVTMEFAGETRSDARMASEGHRATIKKRHFTVVRGPVPRQRPRNPTIAGDRPPRYGEIETRRSLLLLLVEVGGTSLSRCTGRKSLLRGIETRRSLLLKIIKKGSAS